MVSDGVYKIKIEDDILTKVHTSWTRQVSKGISKTTSGIVLWPFSVYYRRFLFIQDDMKDYETIAEKEYVFLKLTGKIG